MKEFHEVGLSKPFASQPTASPSHFGEASFFSTRTSTDNQKEHWIYCTDSFFLILRYGLFRKVRPYAPIFISESHTCPSICFRKLHLKPPCLFEKAHLIPLCLFRKCRLYITMFIWERHTFYHYVCFRKSHLTLPCLFWKDTPRDFIFSSRQPLLSNDSWLHRSVLMSQISIMWPFPLCFPVTRF